MVLVKTIWQKFQALCAVLCIMVYAVSTVYALLLIRREMGNHEQISEREFGELRQFASSAASAGWTGAAFKEDIRDAVFTSQALEAVIITGSGAYAIAIEKTPGIIKWADNAPYFSGGFSFFKRLATVSLPVEGQQALSIHAAASYIDFASLLYILRKALLAILAAVAVSFSLLIIDTTLVKREVPVKPAPPPPPPPPEYDDDDVFEEDWPETEEDETEEEEAPPFAVDVAAEGEVEEESDPFAVDVLSMEESAEKPEEDWPEESGVESEISEEAEAESEPEAAIQSEAAIEPEGEPEPEETEDEEGGGSAKRLPGFLPQPSYTRRIPSAILTASLILRRYLRLNLRRRKSMRRVSRS